MASHFTEEEQIEAFKRWWNENWVTIVLPVIVGIFLYVGWFWWQDHKVAQAQAASDKYEQLGELLDKAGPDGLAEEDKVKAMSHAKDIVGEYKKTLYADMANLALADFYLDDFYPDDKDLDKAADHINQVVSGGANESIRMLAKSRLAKVYIAQGKHTNALTLVAEEEAGAYKSLFAEIRGDILLAQGDVSGANSEYKLALESLNSQASSRMGLIQLKISASTVPEVEVASLAKNTEESLVNSATGVDSVASEEEGSVAHEPTEKASTEKVSTEQASAEQASGDSE